MEIKEYLRIIKQRLWIVAIMILISTIMSAVANYYIIKPTYQANALLYVGKKVNEQEGIAYYDLLLSDQLVRDYRELVKSRLVASTVIKELGLVNMSTDQLAGKVSVSLKADTRLIQIKAEDIDPEKAKDIAAKVTEVFKEKAVELMDVENVQVIDSPEAPSYPVSPRKQLNIMIAVFIGLMAGLGIVFLIEYFDDTIKTPEDVQKHLGLPVIGTIPAFSE